MNRYRYTIQRTILRDGKTQPGVEDTLNVVASSGREAIDEAKKQETPLVWGWEWDYRVTHIDDYITEEVEDMEQEEERAISYLVGQVLAAARAAETAGGAIGQVLSHDLRSIAETAREMAKDTRQRYNRNIHEEIGKMIDMYPDHRFGQILVNMGIVEVEERHGEMVANDPFHEESSVTWSRLKTTTQGNLT